MATSSASRRGSSTRSSTERVGARSLGARVAFVVMAAWLAAPGCVRPCHGTAPSSPSPADGDAVAIQGPPPLRARTFGAVEGAVRCSWVDLDDGEVTGGRMHALSAGLHWYWNRVVRWQLGYELAFIEGGAVDGRLHVFQARFQLVI